jgi:hypothetical protein
VERRAAGKCRTGARCQGAGRLERQPGDPVEGTLSISRNPPGVSVAVWRARARVSERISRVWRLASRRIRSIAVLKRLAKALGVPVAALLE